MKTQVHFSSGKDDWATPQWLFDLLDQEFCFTLDACAHFTNTKVPGHYFSEEDDGLMRSWAGESVFCNPPYSNLERWLQKCAFEASFCRAIVMLIPARTDTKAWHAFASQADEIRFIRSRIKFEGASAGAPFPSAVVVFRPRTIGCTQHTQRVLYLDLRAYAPKPTKKGRAK